MLLRQQQIWLRQRMIASTDVIGRHSNTKIEKLKKNYEEEMYNLLLFPSRRGSGLL